MKLGFRAEPKFDSTTLAANRIFEGFLLKECLNINRQFCEASQFASPVLMAFNHFGALHMHKNFCFFINFAVLAQGGKSRFLAAFCFAAFGNFASIEFANKFISC